MKRQFSIVIAEDHTILREGLNAILSSQSDFKVVGEAGDGLEAISRVQECSPDLVLMDLSMPRMTGIDAIKKIKKELPQTKILALTGHETDEFILPTLMAGADGYVLKDANRDEVLAAIRQVLRGRRYLSKSLSGTTVDRLRDGEKPSTLRSVWETLTRREREILKLVAEGHRTKDIADILSISPKTVEKHRTNLLEKLDIHSAAELTALAAEKGLINK
jgi:DNA-binding NarL/FixJ family response regulator